MRSRFEKMIRAAQDSIVAAVEEVDGKKFQQTAWVREGGGGGITRVLQVGWVGPSKEKPAACVVGFYIQILQCVGPGDRWQGLLLLAIMRTAVPGGGIRQRSQQHQAATAQHNSSGW